jgi:hypothetical protein
MQLVGKKKFGKVKVKSMKGSLDNIPEDCGYERKFKYDIDMHSNGIMGECIEWCQQNCKSKWGWWFKQKDLYSETQHNWEEQEGYMSFEDNKEATAFFLAIGLANMGNDQGDSVK